MSAALRLLSGACNTALIGNGVKNLIEKDYRTAGKLLGAGLSLAYLSPYNPFKPESLLFHSAAGIGASAIMEKDEWGTGLGKFALASGLMSLNLYLCKQQDFLENPLVCILLVSPACAALSGTACLTATFISEQMLKFIKNPSLCFQTTMDAFRKTRKAKDDCSEI